MSSRGHAPSLAERPAVSAVDRHEALLTRVLRGSFWMLNSNLFGRALNLARGVILARLLVPDDFGLFGSGDRGHRVHCHVCRCRRRRIPGLFPGLRRGARRYRFLGQPGHRHAACGVVLGSAPLFARLYHRHDLVPVLAVLAVSLWLQTATTVHRNLVRRSLRFRALAIVDGLLGLATFLIAVALAWWHYGVWSFVLSTLAGSALSACFALLHLSAGAALAVFVDILPGLSALFRLVYCPGHRLVPGFQRR